MMVGMTNGMDDLNAERLNAERFRLNGGRAKINEAAYLRSQMGRFTDWRKGVRLHNRERFYLATLRECRSVPYGV
jgi:hypothetical protein